MKDAFGGNLEATNAGRAAAKKARRTGISELFWAPQLLGSRKGAGLVAKFTLEDAQHTLGSFADFPGEGLASEAA